MPMLTIEQVNSDCPDQVNRFVDLPYRLYANCPGWLPPIRANQADWLNRREHPFYEHAEATFFLAVRDGRDVGRVAALAYAPDHQPHEPDDAQFYGFECEADQEAAHALLQAASRWAVAHDRRRLVGPHGFSKLDGPTLLAKGFDYPQVTTMAPYNHPYYVPLLESFGFEQAGDEIPSYHLDVNKLTIPAWVQELADAVRAKEDLVMQGLDSAEQLMLFGPMALATMMDISERESSYLFHHMQPMLDPRLIQTLLHAEAGLVALILGFPNLSNALRQSPGCPPPEILQAEMTRTTGVIFNGTFIDPSYQVMGLSALLFCELAKLAQAANVQHVFMVHVIGPGKRNANDVALIGAQPVQWHRMYAREL